MASTPISSLTEYLSRTLELSTAPHRYAFRGQANAAWHLRSAATRRLIATHGEDLLLNQPDRYRTHYLNYHNNSLLSPIQRKGLLNSDHDQPLETLATLQHHGAATGLLDFTYNPLVALWFACNEEPKDGKVYRLQLPSSQDHHSNQRILDGRTLDDMFFPSPQIDSVYIWDPYVVGAAAQRAISQQSIFVLDRPLSMASLPLEEIIVDASAKQTLLSELATMGIHQDALFSDLPGFAKYNGPMSPIDYSAEQSLEIAVSLLKSERPGDSIAHFTNHLTYVDQNPDVYALRANAHAEERMIEEAIADYDYAIINIGAYIDKCAGSIQTGCACRA